MIRASSVVRASYLRPSLLGPIAEFPEVLDRSAASGCNTVVLPSPFAAGAHWTQARLGDTDHLAPVFDWSRDAATGLSRLAELARERDLDLVIDVRLDEVAADSLVASEHPQLFRPRRGYEGPLPDPRKPPEPAEAAIARFEDDSGEITGWWGDRLAQWSDAGVSGFRCLWPQQVPAAAWNAVMTSVRRTGDARFWAWTPGLTRPEMLALADCGFDAAFASLAWWDFQSDWFVEEDASLRAFPAVIAAVDDPFDPSVRDAGGDVEPRRNRSIEFAVATGDGLMVALDDAADGAFEARLVSASERIATLEPARRTPLRPLLTTRGQPAHALLAEFLPQDGQDLRRARVVVFNADTDHVAMLSTADVLRHAGEYSDLRPLGDGRARIEPDTAIALEPAEVQAFDAERATAVVTPPEVLPQVTRAVVAPRIAIEDVAPVVEAGRFPAKHVVGERVAVSADLLCDGHDLLDAEVLWRAVGERNWNRAPMRQLGNDRWAGEFSVDRIGRHEFAIEAWRDVFATARMDLEKKRLAGNLSALDLDEACRLVIDAGPASGDPDLIELGARLQSAPDDAARTRLLVSPETAQAMARSGPRPFLARCATTYQLDVERRGAAYSSWYELFPRSLATPGPDGVQPHGTFDDVIARLPAIRDMGFDVLYMTPINPIGRINRKGRNNSVTSQPGEPGSPYAIGASEGGHDAVHPELGTIEDFRRLVAAAAANGLEVALDFAIQCSPDHPWLREHPEWFSWRSDGSIRYAENPPKKYEDIVNVDFYTEGATPALWHELRDVVEFWIRQGVRLFRVDNPHTKPFPFWEWMIGDIRARYPDAVFLSEAFTRPKLMHRLAKVGFSQSYTYFTWRNTKAELTEYMEELAHGEGRDYFRPHFFVNTPDINPVFLQQSGRAGHLIRAALATTLSGLWGMYSGFELCEATPLPGKEEYLDSEKYQLRSRDWDQPGNIVAEITRLNLLRRLNPALQTHLGIRFYNAFNDQVLYYGKRQGAHEPLVLVAVNLDPHAAQEADFELPLWEFGLPDDAALEVEDLWNGTRSVWRGKHQHMRLDPARLPFAIWRVHPIGVSAP
ncbi:MAG: alpha-1,4-glucan--maltose-1-phosphate maltosyltransferase [Pseudomonadota bacterium]|nr:alpha-1,4-glucan--maltose-1-phosphate maltosyltransferase [Pseudomonadota bacterium]